MPWTGYKRLKITIPTAAISTGKQVHKINALYTIPVILPIQKSQYQQSIENGNFTQLRLVKFYPIFKATLMVYLSQISLLPMLLLVLISKRLTNLTLTCQKLVKFVKFSFCQNFLSYSTAQACYKMLTKKFFF